MSGNILTKSNEELFDFSDVSDEIVEELELEESAKTYSARFDAQFPQVLDWAFHKDSKIHKLINEFDDKFDIVPAYEWLLRMTILEMSQYGFSVNDIYRDVGLAIDEIYSDDGEVD